MLNWKVRYAGLLERHADLFDPSRSVLEVGSGTQGIARYLMRPVIGVDRVFDGPVNPNLIPVAGSVLNLPFGDRSFDAVICVDTLEHLPQEARPLALRELLRVAKERVVVSGPMGTFAANGDAGYAEHVARTGGVLPPWLEEHLRYGIPALAEILDTLLQMGCAFTLRVNEGVIQHYAGLLADSCAFIQPFVQQFDLKFPTVAPLCGTAGDLPYSYEWVIDPVLKARANTDRNRASSNLISSASSPVAAELFSIGHQPDRMLAVPGVQRILAGAAESTAAISSPGLLRDDTGDNISNRNASFSEMTAIYWVWKNVKGLDAVGFCHYRRFFDFRPSLWHSTRQTSLRNQRQVERHQQYFADRSAIDRHLAGGSILVACPEILPVNAGEQYIWTHSAEHYLMLVNHIVERHPRYSRHISGQLREPKLYANNMFIMPWRLFEELCEFWFDCLFSIESQSRVTSAGYQARVLAFLSERILDLHFRWLRESGHTVVEYPIFFLEQEAFPSRVPNGNR